MVAGDVVNTAARLQTAAPVGAVLVGEETYAATRNAVEYRPAQPVLAKGKSAPVRAWLALRATSQAGERPMAPVPMIGRDRELAVLTGYLGARRPRRAARSSSPCSARRESASRDWRSSSPQLVADQGARVVRGRSTPYGASTPYSAFAQQVKQTATHLRQRRPGRGARRSSRPESPSSRDLPRRRSTHRSSRCFSGSTASAAVADRETLFFSARVFVESLAMSGPTLLLFEDIHWADASQLDLLETLASRVRDVPVLFVALARPELLDRPADLGRRAPGLHRAPARAARARLRARSSPSSCWPRPTHRGRRRAGRRDGGRQPAVHRGARAPPSPSESTAGAAPDERSRHHRGAARLAASPDERSVLVDASVVGTRLLARRAAPRSPTVRRPVAAARIARGSRPDSAARPCHASGEISSSRFKHALIHDVAYQTLPRAARRERHAAVARFLAATTDDRPVARGARPPLARGRRDRPGVEQPHRRRRPGRHAAGRRSTPSRSTRRRSSSCREDDARRRSVRLQQVVTARGVPAPWSSSTTSDVRRTSPARRGRR